MQEVVCNTGSHVLLSQRLQIQVIPGIESLVLQVEEVAVVGTMENVHMDKHAEMQV